MARLDIEFHRGDIIKVVAWFALYTAIVAVMNRPGERYALAGFAAFLGFSALLVGGLFWLNGRYQNATKRQRNRKWIIALLIFLDVAFTLGFVSQLLLWYLGNPQT